MKSGIYSCDFETITDPDDCRVWAAAWCDIYEDDDVKIVNNIDEFMEFALNEKSTLYFHNLKFDGEFILYWLLTHNYVHTSEKSVNEGEFSTLISGTGQFYSIKLCNGTIIYDSLKVLPFSVDVVAKSFKMEMCKGSIDYDSGREVGHILTDEEKDYIVHDVRIIAVALRFLRSHEMDKMTAGANALHNYKQGIGTRMFKNWFPICGYDSDIRQSYKGGWTYLKEGYEDRDIGEGIVLDVNSLYPSRMYDCLLPFREPVFFEGEYEPDPHYPLYVIMVTLNFELKENHLPTIQIKRNLAFNPTEYLKSSEGEDITMCVTSVDWELIKDHYNIYNVTYHCGWKFQANNGFFKDYIDYWMEQKIEASKQGNAGLRTLAKLMLNSLYGKFGTNPRGSSKIPYLDNGIVRYKITPVEDRKSVYIPMASFITAYARDKTIRSAQLVYDRFVYSDTDSLHLIGTEIPKELEIDDNKLGAWKHESTFRRARFLRAKSYIEEINGELKVTCCGMPARCHSGVTWDNFHPGSIYGGKLMPRHVKGGIVLENKEFTIQC